MSDFIIPQGSTVVLRDSKGESRWYNQTKQDIPVNGEPKDATCPLRNQPVKTVTHMGWEIFFLRAQMTVSLSAKQIQDAKNLELYALDYDIPTAAFNRSGMVHPSTFFHSIGIRSTESCWIIPKGKIPYTYLNELTKIGATWRVKKYDSSEAASLINDAILSLESQMKEAVKRAEKSLTDAVVTLEATPAEDDPIAAREKYLKHVKVVQKRYDEKVEKLKISASVLSIELRFMGIEKASSYMQTMAISMQNRARVYADAAVAARAVGTAEGNAIAAAVEANTMDPGALADYLDEQQDGSGQAVRNAFIGGSDNEYSLTEGEDAA